MADPDPLEDLLRRHYKAAGWAWSSASGIDWKPKLGRWSCACGAHGDVHKGQQVTALWRRHLAREIRRLVAAEAGAR